MQDHILRLIHRSRTWLLGRTQKFYSPRRPEIRSGEAPLRAFISSVIDTDLQWARAEAVAAFGQAPYLSVWAFEYTPPSSEPLDESYLRKVRESDIVIWLAGDRTTEAVRSEVREALAAKRRLIVIKLPVDSRDATTAALLEEVRSRVKYATVEKTSELRRILSLALQDEAVRAFRGRPEAGRMERLEEVGRASRGRCIARWQGAGLQSTEAALLADIPTVGALDLSLAPNLDRPVVVLVGDLGIGKSICAERFLQAAIVEARHDLGAAIPVYVDAHAIDGPLEVIIRHKSDGLGSPNLQGAVIVIDGVEALFHRAPQLLAEARALVHTWPNTRVLMTSRPHPDLDRAGEAISLPLLSDAAALDLVSRAAGRELSPYHRAEWPESVTEAIRRPLFALLLGSYLRDASMMAPTSVGEILTRLVERALGQAGRDIENSSIALRRLGALTIDRGGPVFSAEIGTEATVWPLLESGLVVVQGDVVDWPLPILGEWFAAEALHVGLADIGTLIQDLARLERWRYPLTIFVARFDHARVADVLDPIARLFPGLAAQIVRDSLTNWAQSSTVSLPRPLEIARRVRFAMRAWIDGLGPLAALIAPLYADGTLRQTGVRTTGTFVEVSWYYGSEQVADVVALPGQVLSRDSSGWNVSRMAEPVTRPAWEWKWSLEDLRERLGKALEWQIIPLAEGVLGQEAIWRWALALTNRMYLESGSIPIPEMEERLSGFPVSTTRMIVNGEYVEVDRLRLAIERAKRAGITELQAPWPGRDQPLVSGWVWEGYSDVRLLERLNVVFAGALEGYRRLAYEWCPRLAPMLSTAALMPVLFKGTVYRTDSPDRARWLRWYFEPLSHGEQNRVDIQWADSPPLPNRDTEVKQLESLWQLVRSRRSDRIQWISLPLVRQRVSIFDGFPASDIAYRWLWQDLQRLSWTERTYPGPLRSRQGGPARL